MTLALPSQLDLLDQAEICVAGGGLAGVAAALHAAEAGLDVALVEERGALGWEVSHGLELFLTPGSESPALLKRIGAELKTQNAFRDGVLDPGATEVLLDRLLAAAKVRLHFRAHASSLDLRHDAVHVTTKSGPLAVKARACVDATEGSRLARSAGAKVSEVAQKDAAYSRAFLLCAVTPPACSVDVKVEGLSECTVRPTLWPNEAHVRITYAADVPEKAESVSRFAVARAIEALRKAQPGFEKASLSLSSHEPFALRVGRLDAASLPENLSVAGPALLGRKPSLEERVQLGERAAATLVEQLRGAAVR